LILVGVFGVLVRAPFFLPIPLLRDSSSGCDDGRDGHKTDEYENHVATCSRSPWFHLASDRQSIVICGICFGGTDLPFSKTSSSTLGLLQSITNIIAALQLFALALMRCGVSFKVLLKLA